MLDSSNPTNQYPFIASTGVRLGNPYCDPLVTSVGHKITARQRWTPTPIQLQILESIFDQGTGTPSKQKIKEITSELSQHGQISETNVYNWFQNRRARSKRKQLNSSSNNAETEGETDAESPKEKRTKPENMQSQQNDSVFEETSYLQSHEIVGSGGMDSMCAESNKAEHVFQSDGNDQPSRSMGQLTFIESMLETPRIDHLIGKMEVPVNYDPYHSGEDYGMAG